MAASSIVTTTSCVVISLRISSLSSGLAKRRSATVVDSPLASSWSAAFSASASRVPSERIATLLPSLHDPALADFEPLRRFGQRHAGAAAARIAEGDRAAVVLGGGVGHVDQLGLVRRGHDHEIGQGREIGDVEAAGMGRPVGADQPGAVDGEAHRQVLDRHVVHHLVEGALQEGRIDRAERPHALRGEAGGEGHRVLFGNADVEGALGMRLGELVDAGARGHGGGDGADPLIGLGELGQRLAEHVLVGRRAARALLLLAGDDVELVRRRDTCRRCSRPGRSPCPSASRHGPGSGPARCRGRFPAPGSGGRDCARRSGRRNRSPVPRTGCRPSPCRGHIPRPSRARGGPGARASCASFEARLRRPRYSLRGHHPREIGRQPADRRRDRHVVVVEDHDQPVARLLGVVHRLVGHARAHRAVADHRDAAARLVVQLVGDGKAERGGDRGAECAAPNGSYSLSLRLVNPERPPPWRSVRMRSRRPVMILCG